MIAKLLLLKTKSVLYADTVKDDQIMQILEILFKKVLFATHKDAIAYYEDEAPDIILTMIKNDDSGSLIHIKQLRHLDYHIPIIIITEQDMHPLLIDIANLSVDGFLHKPFNYATLTDTLCRALKRNLDESGLVVLGNNLVFNIASKELYFHGSVVALGTKENQFLLLLIENRSRTITKEEIEKKLWPLDSISDSAVKKMVLRIRQKMKCNVILSVRGIGYRLDIKFNQETHGLLESA